MLEIQGVKGANSYMTGLSSFLGFAAFGAQGVLLGPLIICSATLMYRSLVFFGSSFQVQTYGKLFLRTALALRRLLP